MLKKLKEFYQAANYTKTGNHIKDIPEYLLLALIIASTITNSYILDKILKFLITKQIN